jgi:hypothetical protein
MTICVLPDGSREVCDQNGGNCKIYDRSAPPTPGRGRVVVDAGSVLVEANPGRVVPSRGVTAARVSIRLDRRDNDRP